VLQPARFMQNSELMFWNDVVEHDRLSQPYSLSSKFGWVDYRDVAEVAAMAMTGSELSYGTFELSAPGNLDSYQVAELLSEVLGRPITASQLPADQFTAHMPEGGIPRRHDAHAGPLRPPRSTRRQPTGITRDSRTGTALAKGLLSGTSHSLKAVTFHVKRVSTDEHRPSAVPTSELTTAAGR
jgi:uncharacterized protein YbjT (DUF2867 family)